VTISAGAFATNVADLGLLEREKKFLDAWRIRSNGAKEIGLGGKKRVEDRRFQAMVRKRVYSFLLRLRYLRLLAEINILFGLKGIKRESDFRKTKA
jgi:hypothetical protein